MKFIIYLYIKGSFCINVPMQKNTQVTYLLSVLESLRISVRFYGQFR